MATATQDPIRYLDRQTGIEHTETVLGGGLIDWAYRTRSGQIAAPALFGNSLVSRLIGRFLDSPRSRGRIAPTIAELGIDPSEFRDSVASFASFNRFFYRHLKASARPFSTDPTTMLCPADGRVLVYPQVSADDGLAVKGVEAPVGDLLGMAAPALAGGSAVVVRLCPADYHRYHFPCAAQVIGRRRIPGAVHSVNPVALAAVPKVFCRNKRELTLLRSAEFGRIAYLEVGAFGVAAIHQTYQGNQVARMQEKGYFAFGGSTVVLVFEPGAVHFDDDLVAASARGVETLVRVGETIGHADASNSSGQAT